MAGNEGKIESGGRKGSKATLLQLSLSQISSKPRCTYSSSHKASLALIRAEPPPSAGARLTSTSEPLAASVLLVTASFNPLHAPTAAFCLCTQASRIAEKMHFDECFHDIAGSQPTTSHLDFEDAHTEPSPLRLTLASSHRPSPLALSPLSAPSPLGLDPAPSLLSMGRHAPSAAQKLQRFPNPIFSQDPDKVHVPSPTGTNDPVRKSRPRPSPPPSST